MTTKELPAFVELDNVTFNKARAAIAILADGHERQGNELEGLKALVAQLSETVRAQAQQIAEMRADFTATVQQQEQAVNQQLSDLGAELTALGDELQEAEDRAHARIDAAVTAYEAIAAKQEQVQAESQHDKPVQVPAPIRKNAADLQRTRDLIAKLVSAAYVTAPPPTRNALRFIISTPPQPRVIETPTHEEPAE
ncbi:hypothetical protein DIE15_01965 [Burkholderia sp. Bp9031]|uniref:hypothetical protein n=1 Tax=Burkholderia sp. Bp9031 TaxID=2184566 RepID=UPI000F5F8448|nr:hypothetical protein [Burkholderia sp. Bp9031]RQZ20855.1 hypothetical protein DIE15_01965 [Burkholderia sp. Bp9031]